MQDNEEANENVVFDAEPEVNENANNEEHNEEWEGGENGNVINEVPAVHDALGEYAFICEDDFHAFDKDQNKQEIYSYYRANKKSWFRSENAINELNSSIAERKRALKDELKENPDEFGKQIIRYCINKRAYLFLKSVSGNNNNCFMQLLDNAYDYCKVTKISELFIDGTPYRDFYYSHRNKNKEHVEFSLKEINEIKIWYFVPLPPQDQQQQEGPYDVIRQVLTAYLRANLFPDILQTLGHLIWTKNKNNV